MQGPRFHPHTAKHKTEKLSVICDPKLDPDRRQTDNKSFIKKGWEYSSAIEHMLSMSKTLGMIPGQGKKTLLRKLL